MNTFTLRCVDTQTSMFKFEIIYHNTNVGNINIERDFIPAFMNEYKCEVDWNRENG
jgi:hypothetical protein